jgi:hypothetical protein
VGERQKSTPPGKASIILQLQNSAHSYPVPLSITTAGFCIFNPLLAQKALPDFLTSGKTKREATELGFRVEAGTRTFVVWPHARLCMCCVILHIFSGGSRKQLFPSPKPSPSTPHRL